MAAKAITQKLGALVETNVKMVNLTSMVAGVVDGMMSNHQYLTDYGVHMVRRLLESGMGAEEVAWSQVLPTATPMVPNQSQVPWNFYLSPAGSKYLPDIDRLARMDTPEADDKILHYCIEGIRLNGTFGSYRESAATTLIDDGGRAVHVKPGDKVFVSFNVRLDRPLEDYIDYGVGPHSCLGMHASRVASTTMLKTMGKLDGLRRAPGPKGVLKKIPSPGGFYVYMREAHESYFPFPTTVQVNWDGPLLPLPK
ncbi:linoleate diol synthase [Cryomyces antarcticus]